MKSQTKHRRINPGTDSELRTRIWTSHGRSAGCRLQPQSAYGLLRSQPAPSGDAVERVSKQNQQKMASLTNYLLTLPRKGLRSYPGKKKRQIQTTPKVLRRSSVQTMCAELRGGQLRHFISWLWQNTFGVQFAFVNSDSQGSCATLGYEAKRRWRKSL